MSHYAIALLVFLFVIHSTTTKAAEEINRYTVAAEEGQVLPGQTQTLVFGHGEMLVTLGDGGLWEVEGPVRHNRFLCGTYQVGAKFGRGSPDCVNVNWLSDVQYVTSLRQCNSAVRIHKGNSLLAVDPAPETPFDIDRVTCAQIYIKCNGAC